MGVPMYRFEKLTKYIPLLDQTEIGNWVIDTENDGTIEHPILYSEEDSQRENAFRIG